MVVGDRPRWQPTALGTLDRVLVLEEEPSRLFPGDDAYYRERDLERRVRLWAALEPVLGRVLGDGETVLCAVPAVRRPGVGARAAFGFLLWLGFHRVALVLTDRRLVEVLLDGRGRRPHGRVWSLPWSQADAVVMTGRTLSYLPVAGTRHRWSLPGRGDRALVSELVLRIDGQLVPGTVPTARPVPVRHCPGCGAAGVVPVARCGTCGAGLTTAATAGWLGLAFPGLGLWYAGQRSLAVATFALEAGLAAFAAGRLLLAESLAAGLGAAAVALGALVLVRLEGVVLARILAARTRTVAAPRRWRAAGALGAALTVVVVAAAAVYYGGVANRVDRTPDFSDNRLGWNGGFDTGSLAPDELAGIDRQGLRSVWRRGDGPLLVVRSQALPIESDFSEQTERWAASHPAGAGAPTSEVVAGLRCARSSWLAGDREIVEWLVLDVGHRDVHVLTAVVHPGTRADVERDLGLLLGTVDWRSVD